MKGIILAGGTGTRLWPITKGISKQLMPIYDKPMIYYPLSTLMMADINDVLLISTREHQSQFQDLLGDGSSLGMSITYAIQEKPEGLAQAFLIGEDFIGDDSVALVLGDNIFHGAGLGKSLRANSDIEGGLIFATHVAHPEAYGVVEFDAAAHTITPSSRGELEITAINDYFLQRGELRVQVLDRGVAWLDTGTFESMMQASEYVRVIEERQGLKIGCIEEISWRAGWISDAQLTVLAEPLRKSGYGTYLDRLLVQ